MKLLFSQKWYFQLSNTKYFLMGALSLSKPLCFTVLLGLLFFTTNAQIKADFIATPLQGCAPFSVSFTDQSTGPVTSWKWDLGESFTAMNQNPGRSYLNPGTFDIRLIVFDAAGNTDTLIKRGYITVFPAPTVNFTGMPLSGCFPLPVNFTDGSTAGIGTTITKWLWDFGDGISDSVQNPSHIYTATGNYNVSLRVTNANGCAKTLTRENYVNVATGVKAAFTNNVPTSCSAPQTINFQNQSTGTGTLTYEWLFGDGGSSTALNPSHTYNTSGSFTVRLVVKNSSGCADTLVKPNAIIIGNVNADFTAPATLCVGVAATFTNTSTPNPVSVNWDFGDGTTSTDINPTKVYTTPGTYTINLVSNFGGCTDTEPKQITILAKPTASFTGNPLTACSAPLTVNFTNTSTGATSYKYIFGDGVEMLSNGNESHTYTANGSYTVQLIAINTNGCSDTVTRTNYVVIAPPQVSITNLPILGCSPLTNVFSATVNSVDPIVSYAWEFGDGTTGTGPNPSHTFATGVYDIKLTVTTAGGCTATATVLQGITASTKPTAGFIANPREVCAKDPVVFQNQSTGTITRYEWFFGDGTTSGDINPMHIYQDTGFFDITLVVSNNGCTDTLRILDYVYIKAPIAIFNINNDCINTFSRSFTDRSIGADTWAWDFGDGATANVQNPTHIYAAVGTYTVTLTVTNILTGCDFTTSATTTIADEDALFTATLTELCKNTATTFNATSKQTTSQIVNFEWDFGDGTQGTGISPSHVYTQAGLYTVKLIITDVNGCRDSLIRNQYIKVNGPTADFMPAVPGSCLMTNVTFIDLSTPDATPHPIIKWYFNYGDGVSDTLNGPPFVHAYNAPGNYNVSLKLLDSYGCTDSINKQSSIIISKPVANFVSADSLSCPGKNINFTNLSTGPGLSFVWDFGDGSTSTDTNPTHIYAADGNYDVRLSIVDMYGCPADTTKPAYIKINTPIANFSADKTESTCPPLIVQFTNSSTFQDSLIWDFGDGGTSMQNNPSHFYNIAGTYTATLTIFSKGGCISTKTQEITVRGPKGTFSYQPISGCKPHVVNFTANTLDIVTFTWDYNDGTTETTTVPFSSHPYTLPGVYIPTLILTDPAGCSVPVVGLEVITVNAVKADFNIDRFIKCDTGSVILSNTSFSNDVITEYKWDFGDGITSTETNPTHFYNTTGNYFVTLIANTQTGCSDTLRSLIPIKVIKSPEAGIAQSPNGCEPLDMNFRGTLQNPDTSAVQWRWAFSDGSVNSGQVIPSMIFNTPGFYGDTVYAVNSSGCRDTAFMAFEVFAKPTINAGIDTSICQGTGKTITASGGVAYTWSPAAGLSCTNCTAPTATPDSATNYIVTGESAQGCFNNDSINVVVNYPFKMQFSTGDTLCVGQSGILTASGAVSYIWSPTTGLNISTGPRVTASPTVDTRYTVTGFDGKNCFTDVAFYDVKVYPMPTVVASEDKTINVGKLVSLTARSSNDVTNLFWTPTTGVVSTNLPSITVMPTLQTEYKVTVTNPGGCTAVDYVNVFVICDGSNIFIPNTFSPNGDGANDQFYPRGTGLFTVKQLRIYNRWGEEVFARYNFKANEANKGWDGTFNNQKLNTDVYVYYAEIQCENNSSLVYKGNISLIR